QATIRWVLLPSCYKRIRTILYGRNLRHSTIGIYHIVPLAGQRIPLGV
ncbi:MAG: hypothetical protein ACI8P3_002508, partial [Saprospiraceae bacterium]